MLRKTAFLALSASAMLAIASTASAQAIIPNFQPAPKVPLPKIEGVPPEIQQQLQQIFEQAAMAQGGQLGGDGTMRWGGVRLKKTDANLQQQLGLPENEGLVVTQVDVNSPADKAGLKASDVLVKINGKSVPGDLDGFSKLVKEQKVDESADLVVVRKGKEETLKGTKMPAVVQFAPQGGFGGGIGGIGGAGGGAGRPGIAGLPGIIGGIRINPPNRRVNPLGQGQINKLNLEMTINGAKVMHKQDGDQFSAEYSKDDLKIALSGKIENGQRKLGEVTVTEGKESKTYATPKDIPVQHRVVVQQLLQGPFNGLMSMPALPNLQNFPGFPEIPGFDK